MGISRKIARPLLASMFIGGGMDAFRHPESKAKAAEVVTSRVAGKAGLPSDTVQLVRINGGIQVGAGALLAIGRFRRLAALALIGSILPTTYAGHRFWEEDDAQTRAQQQVHFLKNLGLLGGLILAAVDTEGRPSLGWRARRKTRQAARVVQVASTAGGAATSAASAAAAAGAAGAKATRRARKRGRRAAKATRRTARQHPAPGGTGSQRSLSREVDWEALDRPDQRPADDVSAAHRPPHGHRAPSRGGLTPNDRRGGARPGVHGNIPDR